MFCEGILLGFDDGVRFAWNSIFGGCGRVKIYEKLHLPFTQVEKFAKVNQVENLDDSVHYILSLKN